MSVLILLGLLLFSSGIRNSVFAHQKDNVIDNNSTECPAKIGQCSSLTCAFKLSDASFFNNTQMLEIVKGTEEFNIPIIRANRKLVASINGGLQYPSVLVFNPQWGTSQHQPTKSNRFKYPSSSATLRRPSNDEDIAFMTAVVSYTEELAYKQAKRADNLLDKGVYLGPLHGIPYGLKDIISVPKYKTTWGSTTFKNQVLNTEAWVYKRLKSAGAVLVAKLVSGSLAYDDIWFGGRTRNPWNIEEFSTGSSAGPAVSTSAGMVPFAIGTETAGSITFPAARCGITGLRPTFGSIGRTGVMSLSESLEKIQTRSSRDMPFKDPFSVDITKLRVGYVEDAETEVVKVLESKGVKMVPFKLNYTVDSVQGILNFTMDVDMLAHFDEWQRSGSDRAYEAQEQWPIELRRARLIPAVDYVQAQRARGRLIREVEDNLKGIDGFIGNATDWEKVCMGNLVGMPVIVVPTGLKPISHPPPNTRRRTTITTAIYAPPQHDHIGLALAMAYQSVTHHHKQRPPIDDLGPHDVLHIPSPPPSPLP
ncbi:hypothetical protein CsatA_019899 [Cannabis sativa]